MVLSRCSILTRDSLPLAHVALRQLAVARAILAEHVATAQLDLGEGGANALLLNQRQQLREVVRAEEQSADGFESLRRCRLSSGIEIVRECREFAVLLEEHAFHLSGHLERHAAVVLVLVAVANGDHAQTKGQLRHAWEEGKGKRNEGKRGEE